MPLDFSENNGGGGGGGSHDPEALAVQLLIHLTQSCVEHDLNQFKVGMIMISLMGSSLVVNYEVHPSKESREMLTKSVEVLGLIIEAQRSILK